MTEGQQQRIILLGAAGTLAVLFGLYVFVVLLRVLWARWQAYLSRWARERVERDRLLYEKTRPSGGHRHHKQKKKKRALPTEARLAPAVAESDSDSRSWSSSDESDSRSY
jgi:hypothetical protein